MDENQMYESMLRWDVVRDIVRDALDFPQHHYSEQ